MFKPGAITSHMNLRDKIFSLDSVLVSCIFLLGLISFFAMYSTDGGEFAYHTKSHIIRFFIFFTLFFIVALLPLNLWYNSSTIFYLAVLLLLILVKYFGLTSSGSQRWLNLYFINLQPSELMKVALIIFLARYYYKIPSEQVTNLKHILTPLFALIIPVTLVVSQPDLGTALLIAVGGLGVIWLTGFNIKYFFGFYYFKNFIH